LQVYISAHHDAAEILRGIGVEDLQHQILSGGRGYIAIMGDNVISVIAVG